MPKTKWQTRNKAQVLVWLTPELRAELRQVADETGIPQSAIIERYLDRAIRKYRRRHKRADPAAMTTEERQRRIIDRSVNCATVRPSR